MSDILIPVERSVIWAADVSTERYMRIAPKLAQIGLGGVKLGFDVALGMSLSAAVDEIKNNESEMVVIYDHQKAANDIPDTGKAFARRMKKSEVDAAILFPFTGLDAQKAWTSELQAAGVGVIIGSEMTHPGIYDHIKSGSFEKIFELAIEQEVTNFVVPGNKIDRVRYWRRFFDDRLGAGNFDLFSPGLITQGGDVSETGLAAGRRFHGIVGRGIHGEDEKYRTPLQAKEAAKLIVEQLAGTAIEP